MQPSLQGVASMSKLALSALACAVVAVSAWGQESRGSLIGRVLDASGAAVPGARVKVTSKNMGTAQTVPANQDGFYQATYLIPGLYRVEAEVSGFKKYIRDE
ncbi:MAG TPA: hypothetical protein DEH78_31985, partial [Solibacterales bacterium]|nr:hypothetical protein [Bryobacterales bacterium]